MCNAMPWTEMRTFIILILMKESYNIPKLIHIYIAFENIIKHNIHVLVGPHATNNSGPNNARGS